MEKREKTLEQIKNAALIAVNSIGTRLIGTGYRKQNTILVARQEVDIIFQNWPGIIKKTVIDMIEKYGEPNEACASRITWYENAPWKRTVIFRDEIPHSYPLPHNDFLMQTINYAIPADHIGNIGIFNGSILIDRTAGEVSARCDSESRNFLILNLMNDIVTGKLDVTEARKKYADDSIIYILNRAVPYADKFHFHLNSADTADLDKTLVTESMIQQSVNKVIEALSR